MAPSFPSERKRVVAPRTGLLTCASISHLPKSTAVRLALSGFPAEILQFPVVGYDGEEGRGAHSCGAVAGFHRFPEHPGDCCGDVRRLLVGASRYGMEAISMSSTFIAGLRRKVKREVVD